MRIERLACNRVKVIITVAELSKMNVDPKKLRPDSRELHAFMFYIMQTIHRETDFNPFSGQITMEAVPYDDGMCIIISKIEIGKKRYTKEELRRVKNVTPKIKRKRTEIFCFNSFEDMCSALSHMSENALLKGELFKMDTEYMIVVPGIKMLERDCAVLAEFSDRKSKHILQHDFIKEHGTSIANGEKLLSMAEGIKNL